MEATLKSPSEPASAEETQPDWVLWKDRWLDGGRAEYFTEDVIRAYGRTFSRNNFRLSIGGKVVGEPYNPIADLCSCCGSAWFRKGTKYAESKMFSSTKGGNWADRCGIYMFEGMTQEQAKKALDLPDDMEYMTFQDGEEVHTLAWRMA